MITYYCQNMEEALRRAKKEGRLIPVVTSAASNYGPGEGDLLCIVTGWWWHTIRRWDGSDESKL